MSFPRVVPIAQRKIDYKLRRRIMRGGILYSVGLAGVGEYLGWWDKYNCNIPGEDMLETVQMEDEKSWRAWTTRAMHVSSEKAQRIMNDRFVENLPLGVKHVVQDPRLQFGYKPEQHAGLPPHTPGGPHDDPDMVRVYDGAPGSAPTLIKKEDLVSFTSSKSKKEEGAIGTTKS